MNSPRGQKTVVHTAITWSLWVTLFIAYMVGVALLLRFLNTPPPIPEIAAPLIPVPVEVIQEAVAEVKPPVVGKPVRLIIPKLNISSIVASVGVKPDGAMDIAKNPDNVAWYNLGARPGDKGSAVIAGHYGWDNGRGSVFNSLHTLIAGDTISVEDENGVIISFVVRASESHDPNTDATHIFRSSDGKSHLNLVTCEGTWSRSRQTYSSRLVVFADKV